MPVRTLSITGLLILAMVSFASAQPSQKVRDGRIWLPRAEIDPSQEHVYGLSYRATGPAGTLIRPVTIRTYRSDGEQLQQLSVNNHYATFLIESTPEGTVGRVEVFTKRGAASIELEVEARGPHEVTIDAFEVVDGGFPDHAPVPGAAYLSWIDALQPNARFAKAMAAPRPNLPGHAKTLDDETKAFLEIPLEQLTTFGPVHRPFSGGFGPWHRIGHEWEPSKDLKWDPRRPNELRDEKGNLVDPHKLFPPTGYEEVVGVNGVVQRYAYHDPPEDQWDKVTNDNLRKGDWKKLRNPPAARIYLDNIMADARCRAILRATRDLAQYAAATGDRDAGVRAALLYYGLAKGVPNWPVYGTMWGSEHHKFHAPDAYETWFAFPIVAWSTPAMGFVAGPADDFALISTNDEIWAEASKVVGEDAFARVANDFFLHLLRFSMRMDAYHRTNPWTFYHNTIGQQMQAYMKIARAVGEPEIVHYVVKRSGAAMRLSLMADGMFPESTSYHNMMLFGVGMSLWPHEGYRDPEGFVSTLSKSRIDDLRPRQLIPLFARASEVADRLKFPDGGDATIHDTWPSMARKPRELERDANSYLLTDFGHAILGQRRGADAIEAHLHYSGYYNHANPDYLTFTLWAYGDELAADIGYTHMGGYTASTGAHNLVVVDGKGQKTTGHRGDLLTLHMTRSGAQFAQADATRQAYDDMRLYRRAVMHLPMGDHQDVVLDIFEVAGGKRHDWMTNGVADYDQVVESSLSFQRTGQPVADDGRVIDDITDPALSAGRTVRGRDLAGVYAAFRNAGIGSVKQPWHVTMRPGEVLPEGVPGAGWRATFTGPRPGLRLHQLAPLDATGIVAQAPRHRYPEELRNPREARLEWANRLMPKIIVRREGDNLQSTFVAAWEPFLHQPWIKQARIVQSVPADRGVGVIIEGEHGTARAIYRKPEAPAEPLTVDGLTTDARFAAVRNFKEQTAIDLSEGTRLQTPELRLRVRSSPAMEITAHRPGEQPGDRDEFDVAGDLSTITASARGWVVFRQTGESARWLPLQSVQPQGANEGKLTLTRDGGFRYDPKLQRVRETYYPFRIETAPARLHVPVSVSITRSPDGSDAQLVKVQSSHALSLELRTEPTATVQIRAGANDAWRSIKTSRSTDGWLAVDVSATDLAGDDVELRIVQKR